MKFTLPALSRIRFAAWRLLSLGLLVALALVTSASADNTELQTIITSQNPTNWLQFNNNYADVGSSPATWDPNGSGVGFGDDADSNPNSAYTQSSSLDKLRTTTDVIADAGSLSFLFRMPDIPFTADRWLFDGGADTGPTPDQAFQVRFDRNGDNDPNGELDFRIGNTTVELNGVNPNRHLGKWFYFGATWDDQVNTPEGYAYYGFFGGELSETALNPSNSALIGDGNGFTIGNQEEPPDFGGDRAWRQFEDPNDPIGSGTGRIDEFAIWSDRKLEPAQLQAQFEYWNGNIPSPPPPGTVFDGFDDGSRAKEPGGLNWYAIGGPTSQGRQKPGLTVRDARAEFSDDPNADFNPALYVETIGSNNPFQAVFDDPNDATLGAGIGSTLSASFDMSFQDGASFPSTGQLRFGLYADSDNQFGTSNDPNTSWGESDGDFDKMSPGALGGDAGVDAWIDIGTAATGLGTRLYQRETINDIIGGSGSDTIASGDPNNGGEPNNPFTTALTDPNAVYNLELILERTAPSITGDTIQLTLNIKENDILIGSLSGIDTDPNSSSEWSTTDIFDYFVIKTTQDADFVLDNFSLESLEVPGLAGDFNGDGQVDGADFLEWQRNPSVGSLSDWEATYGLPTTSNAATVPEPSSLALLVMFSGLGLIRRRE